MKDVVAIFDVGKTNKKLLLFDQDYKVVLERIARFNETVDEDGFPCENLDSLSSSVYDSLQEVIREKKWNITAINFSGYGASFVYLDKDFKEVAPLYNYLKPYDPQLSKKFYNDYAGETEFSRVAASPVLCNLNSGMQLYRIKYEKPALFEKIQYALHLPQYLSWLITKIACTDITSIGCHTNLWNFDNDSYHEWVLKEKIKEKLAPILPAHKTIPSTFENKDLQVGIGLHDSSAALIPYLVNFKEPFILISTGTWCISMNPFNSDPLTPEQLAKDCLCYIQYTGAPVKSSRIFAGHEHDMQVKRIAEAFGVDSNFYRLIKYDAELGRNLLKKDYTPLIDIKESAFIKRDLSMFKTAADAYHQLMLDIARQQVVSTSLIMNQAPTKRIFVDGGFSKNEIYMNFLAVLFPDIEVYATSMAQASALGAAICIHDSWNKKGIPSDMLELKFYRAYE